MSKKEQYIDLKNNGRLFPSWVLENFKKYKLPEIFRKENEDPCNADVKLELRAYQEFVGKFLGPKSPYRDILLYHGLGSGKTATSINLMNVLYESDPNLNIVVLIKASLRDDPWMNDLKVWLGREMTEEGLEDVTKVKRFSNIHFVHYDSPFADKDFINVMKEIDTQKPTLYIVDEAHNFIRNVYSNINSKLGKRAQTIYDFIIKEKKEKLDTRVVLISATPGINTPFELALMFNMLRPGIFPSSELEFNRLFVTESNYPILNPLKRNLFMRRIMGLVSYYVGATPDLYAKQELKYVNLRMSEYQYEIYRSFEKIESEIQQRAKRYRKQSKLYRTYTRQACNFVFPNVNSRITGDLRPRPGKFLSEKRAEDFAKGKMFSKQTESEKEELERQALNEYSDAINYFLNETEKYFQEINKSDKQYGRTILDDMEEFKKGFASVYGEDFRKFYETGGKRSKLFDELYKSSPKMLAVVFMSYVSPGKVMVYSNYVVMEGIDMLKIYYRVCGFNDYTNSKENMGYCEYHGRIDPADRKMIRNQFNAKDNILGEKCKIMMLSPSATEGIQLLNIRQEHILEPYWTEVRIQQVIGRGIRQCSHKQLPKTERTVKVYRYKVEKPINLQPDDTVRVTSDEYVEDQAKAKDNLIQSFLSAMREGAIDCELFRNHNMMSQSYVCFKFPADVLFGKNVGPAYREDIKEDVKYDSGLHAKNAHVERIRVIKILGVIAESAGKYSNPKNYWFNQKNGMVYDFETHYPIGRVSITDTIPNKLDKYTYIIDQPIRYEKIDIL